MRSAITKLAGLLLLGLAGFLTWMLVQSVRGDDVVVVTSTDTLAAMTVPPIGSTTSQPNTTTTNKPTVVPEQETDQPAWFTEADTVSIVATSVGIDFPVDVFGEAGTNSCGSQNSPCFERVNNFVDHEVKLVSACQQGVSLFSGHSVAYGKPDSFSNIFDDEEFGWDDGLKDGDIVTAPLSDGTVCVGVVRNFDSGPSELVSKEVMGDPGDAVARFWPKSDISKVATELVGMYGNDSYGVLMASFCNLCRKPDDFMVKSDGHQQRLYNVGILVQWVEIQGINNNPEGAQ